MAYVAWSVTFGEQPSAAKWNILGTNDASFNDGTGIANAAIKPTHLDANGAATWVPTSYTPTYGGFSVAPSSGYRAWFRVGKWVFVQHDPTVGGTSNATTFTISLPVAARTLANAQWTGQMRGQNNGTFGAGSEFAALWQFTSGATVANVYATQSGAGWTASGTKNAQGLIMYEAA